MTDREAMRLALKALRFARDDGYENEVSQEAITALRTAIKQAEKQEPVGVVRVLSLGDGHKPMHWADWTDADNPPPEDTPLYTTSPAAPVQDTEAHYKGVVEGVQKLFDDNRAQTRPATREEKIVRPGVYEVPEFNCPRCGHCCSQRQWVGLTDEEIDAIKPFADGYEHREYARAIEAKLKEKNYGCS